MHALSGPKASTGLDVCWMPCRSPGLICFIPWPSRAILGWKSGRSLWLSSWNHWRIVFWVVIVVWACVCMCVFLGKPQNPVIYSPFLHQNLQLWEYTPVSETPILWLDWPFQCFRSWQFALQKLPSYQPQPQQERPDFHLLLRMDESKFDPYSYQNSRGWMHLQTCN